MCVTVLNDYLIVFGELCDVNEFRLCLRCLSSNQIHCIWSSFFLKKNSKYVIGFHLTRPPCHYLHHVRRGLPESLPIIKLHVSVPVATRLRPNGKSWDSHKDCCNNLKFNFKHIGRPRSVTRIIGTYSKLVVFKL